MSNLENENTCGTSCGCGSNVQGYWQDVENKVLPKEQLANEFSKDEFDSFSVEKTRRNFLKIMGFSVSALPLTGCIKIPVRKALPYIEKVDNLVPGVPNYYASTFNNVPVLVKTREGRPIKIEGNEKSMTTYGGTCAQTQASVLSLYDSGRYRAPMVDGKAVEWDEFDTKLKNALKSADGEIVVVTPPMHSPTGITVLGKFLETYNASHVVYEAVSTSAMSSANEITHGEMTHSEYDFEKADVVIGLQSDFLGTLGNSVANTRQYSKRRSAKHADGMNRHIQVEATMSMTGSNADYRYTKSLADQNDILLATLAGLEGKKYKAKSENTEIIKQILGELKANPGKSLIISGVNDTNVQVITNKINTLLENYGKTIFVRKKLSERLGKDEDFENLVDKINQGKVGAVIFAGVNPVYSYHNQEKLTKALKKIKTVVSTASAPSETAKAANFLAPENHVYESWSDTLVSSKELSLTQPVIQPLFGSRMVSETLMSLADMEGSFYDQIKAYWSQSLEWNQVLHDGVAIVEENPTTYVAKNISTGAYEKALQTKAGTGLQIITYEKYAIKNGDMANNPWLQELPDPVTKATWDNYIMISPALAKENSIKSGDVVKLSTLKHSVTLPVVVQPGTEKATVAVALGYGHKAGGKVSKNLGANAYPFVEYSGSRQLNYAGSYGKLEKTGKFKKLALTQTHHSMEGRDIVRETTFAEYKKNPKAGNEVPKPKMVHIYPEHKKDGHQWAMAINLSTCTGCSSCIISCNAENNVPVVGRQEVANKRDMHWLRIDRYYKGDENQPEVMHMPMLCQHCENAPCENVCPVLATVHSSDGLNQQVYNRCVGTRYCANNCPYKVRRFNWFNYDHSDEYERMVLNPDVSVRSRGIMEKCSMCIQRIQDGKLKAKRERRKLQDGDIKTACQQSCPAEDGIIFGDMNDPNSKISKYLEDERKYAVLEELNVQPRVNYLTKIRNK